MSKLKVSHADMVAITKCQAYIRGCLQIAELKKMSMSNLTIYVVTSSNDYYRGMDSC